MAIRNKLQSHRVSPYAPPPTPRDKPTTENELNAETRLFCKSDLYGELCIILFSSLNKYSCIELDEM
jgi:hypothetical protein